MLLPLFNRLREQADARPGQARAAKYEPLLNPAAGGKRVLAPWRRLPVLLGLLLLAVFLFLRLDLHRHLPASAAQLTAHYVGYASAYVGLTCASDFYRRNPFHVGVPAPADTVSLALLWHNDLRQLFDEHPPSPARLPKPEPRDPPTREQLDSLFEITDAQLERTRRAHAAVVAGLPAYPDRAFKGRGVVMLAGTTYEEYAATALGMLREVGSALPVEVWAKDRTEQTAEWCAELAGEGIACRVLSDYIDVESNLPHPYQWKVLTLLFSAFEEVLFLDADNNPIANPDSVFASRVYAETGAVLWPDYWNHSGHPGLAYALGFSEERRDYSLAQGMSAESGQLLWDKRRHWRALLLATYYNYHGPAFFYTLFNNGWAGWGDKDTFPAALRAAGEPFHMTAHPLITVFAAGTADGIGMVQADPSYPDPAADGHRPMFLHSNMVKWSARYLMCTRADDACDEFPGHGYYAHLEHEDSKVFEHLKYNRRIFATEQLVRDHGLDPEPTLWKVLEHTACTSVFGGDVLCARTREHMTRTFGYSFRENSAGETCADPPPDLALLAAPSA